MQVLMEIEDGYPGHHLELYRHSPRYSGRAVRTCAQGVIDNGGDTSLTHSSVVEYDLPSWLMVVVVLCDQFD
jgi:hypothetical protein